MIKIKIVRENTLGGGGSQKYCLTKGTVVRQTELIGAKIRKDRITYVDKSTLRCGQVQTKVSSGKPGQDRARVHESRYVIKVMKVISDK